MDQTHYSMDLSPSNSYAPFEFDQSFAPSSAPISVEPGTSSGLPRQCSRTLPSCERCATKGAPCLYPLEDSELHKAKSKASATMLLAELRSLAQRLIVVEANLSQLFNIETSTIPNQDSNSPFSIEEGHDRQLRDFQMQQQIAQTLDEILKSPTH
ncbi:hypothetical protein BCR33DRAFT_716223 [Rhizoclosmatium globosum]|uniref:Zn(2)-C6 fungal-type domain-containing protein n=1 Tax=Rhizoclosmatium globosum TaxID=329046 RepID=A0A1Y2CEQ5_9FUNG|nr:hypothetical protein BCR33DRAFT_716223 [Rhizoclosmatium globosum]|eukprot:ORY45550.1 hypothetical protein BCR33DRAFT_716223 [Rhizoclosmatium globosum]